MSGEAPAGTETRRWASAQRAWDHLRGSPVLTVTLVAAVPVVALWAGNAGERIEAVEVARVYAWSAAGSLTVYGLLRQALRDRVRAGRYEQKLWMRDLKMDAAYPPVDH